MNVDLRSQNRDGNGDLSLNQSRIPRKRNIGQENPRDLVPQHMSGVKKSHLAHPFSQKCGITSPFQFLTRSRETRANSGRLVRNFGPQLAIMGDIGALQPTSNTGCRIHYFSKAGSICFSFRKTPSKKSEIKMPSKEYWRPQKCSGGLGSFYITLNAEENPSAKSKSPMASWGFELPDPGVFRHAKPYPSALFPILRT